MSEALLKEVTFTFNDCKSLKLVVVKYDSEIAKKGCRKGNCDGYKTCWDEDKKLRKHNANGRKNILKN